jgi:H+/Cl- antiporter ClcA
MPPDTIREETTPLGSKYGSLSNHVPENSIHGAFKGRSKSFSRVNIHFQGSFWDDCLNFREGSFPHSLVIASAIGIICGVSAYVYYEILDFLLDYIWKKIPEIYIENYWPTWAFPLYIPLVCYTMAIMVGISVKFLGDPGDLNYVIHRVHEKAFIGVDHAIPMISSSQFSILGGGSLGPEAPLVAICAGISGFLSQNIFGIKQRNIVRKHTLMSMSGALAAFFGSPLGGSLFALEVTSRLGLEYFEHAIESIFCGELTLAVFRTLAGLPIGSIWTVSESKLTTAQPYEVVLGIFIGLIGAAFAFAFVKFHGKVMKFFESHKLMEPSHPVQRALLGATAIIILGLLIPQTMFWGEFEIGTIATMSPASSLPHIWPTTGLTGFEMNSFWTSMITGAAKLIAISFTVAGGYRGGFIFPLFSAGCAFGRALVFLFPTMPVQLATLGMAAAINVSITRTSLATPLILVYLSGEQFCLVGVLASSLTALIVTSYMPFLKSQIPRNDLDQSLYMDEDASEIDYCYAIPAESFGANEHLDTAV